MKRTKKSIAVILCLIFIASCFVVSSVKNKVFAAGTISIQFNNATMNNGEATFTVDGNNYTVAIGTKQSDGGFVKYTEGITFNGNVATIDTSSINMSNTYISLRSGNESSVRALVGGTARNFSQGAISISDFSTDHQGPYIFDLEANQQQGGGEQPGPTQGNTTGTIILKAGDSTHAKTYINAAIAINDSGIYGIEPTEDESQIPESTTFDNVSYNSEGANVTIRCGCLINWKYVGTVKVNGTPYNVPDFSNRDVWLAHHQGQELSFDLTVPKADNNTYTIEVNMEEGRMFVGNFLWTGNPEEQYRPGPNGEQEVNDDYIGNARIQLVGVEYVDATGTTVKKKLSELRDDGIMDVGPTQKYHNYSTTDNYVEFGTLVELNGAEPGFDEGSMVVADGTKVTLRIVPEYGYQVTAFTINNQDVVTGDNVSEFTLTIHGGNQHIGARVTKVDNDVKATATEVNAENSGIILGEGTLDSGTARLSIADAKLTEAKTTAFEEQVAKLEETSGEEYEIAAVFDINLNQVFYKGNEGSDVWYGESLEELENPAALELSLNDINMEGAVLVHNIHDEANFEVIEARGGNTETNTKVYPVDSFSTYAVVTRKNAAATTEDTTESEKTESKNVKTGDYILIACTVFVAASLILVVTKRAKSKKNRE